MAPKAGAGGEVAPKVKKDKKEKSVVINVSDYIDHEDDLPFESFAIDKERKRGQTRPVEEKRVRQLKDYYLENPPRIIEVSTWEDPGIPLCALPVLCMRCYDSL